MKKTLCMLLLSALLLSALAACGETPPPASDGTAAAVTSEAPAETTAATDPVAEAFAAAAGLDFEGSDFVLLYYSNALSSSWVGIPTDMNPEEETGDVLNDAVYRRNRTVEEAVNVVISELPQKGIDAVPKAVTASVMAGDEAYDLVFQSIWSIMPMTTAGLLTDFMTLDVDLGAPWYDHKSVAEMTISGRIYSLCSDITYIDKLATIVTYFNKSFADDYSLRDYYAAVLDGSWTFDAMLEDAEKVVRDVDGDGAMGIEDVYGISCQNAGGYYFSHAAGVRVCTGSGDSLRLAIRDEKFISVLTRVIALMHSDLYFNTQTYNLNNITNLRHFASDKALFLVRPAQSLFGLREMTSDFGIIPMPRYDENSDYIAPMNIYPGVMLCVPKSADTGMKAAVMTLLAAESHAGVMPVLYDVVLDTKITRDTTSAAMLDIIFGSRVYDIGLICDLGGIRHPMDTGEEYEVASTIAALADKAQSDLDTLLATVASLP